MLLYGVPAQTPLVENADLIDEEAPPVVRFEKQLIGAAAAHLPQPETLPLQLQPVAGRQRIVCSATTEMRPPAQTHPFSAVPARAYAVREVWARMLLASRIPGLCPSTPIGCPGRILASTCAVFWDTTRAPPPLRKGSFGTEAPEPFLNDPMICLRSPPRTPLPGSRQGATRPFGFHLRARQDVAFPLPLAALQWVAVSKSVVQCQRFGEQPGETPQPVGFPTAFTSDPRNRYRVMAVAGDLRWQLGLFRVADIQLCRAKRLAVLPWDPTETGLRTQPGGGCYFRPLLALPSAPMLVCCPIASVSSSSSWLKDHPQHRKAASKLVRRREQLVPSALMPCNPFTCGSFSFAGEKAGWAPPQWARLVRCTATHSTALHMWALPEGMEPVTMHTNFGSWCGPRSTARGRRTGHGNKGKELAACSFCSVHVSLKLLASPECSFSRSSLQHTGRSWTSLVEDASNAW
ncbi:hypothetical protein Trihar35433_10356 [Trichoderma harzianum]|nr:hypothetical protein Trihar35433_10356 [Trichoderma harzianum]